ncbi:hypothetical protein Goarm_001547, partial [Gossypium armourianum]|nr:hypothetical protein [Gossypium armourianum]
MNAYYQANGRHDFNCDFNRTGVITSTDPSHAACNYSVNQGSGLKLESSVAANTMRFSAVWHAISLATLSYYPVESHWASMVVRRRLLKPYR